jgi:hypothetical protein
MLLKHFPNINSFDALSALSKLVKVFSDLDLSYWIWIFNVQIPNYLVIFFLYIINRTNVPLLLHIKVKVSNFVMLVRLFQFYDLLTWIELEHQIYLLVRFQSKSLLKHFNLHSFLKLVPTLILILLQFLLCLDFFNFSYIWAVVFFESLKDLWRNSRNFGWHIWLDLSLYFICYELRLHLMLRFKLFDNLLRISKMT